MPRFGARIQSVLTPVKEADAELGGQAARAPIRRRSSVSLPSRTGDEGFLVAEKAAAAAAADDDYDPDSCSFQFAAAVYYVEAHDGICEVDVMRIGSTLKPAWVDFACESGAALGGASGGGASVWGGHDHPHSVDSRPVGSVDPLTCDV